MMDGYLGQLDAMGRRSCCTADHGMNDKHGGDGKPQVVYLQDVLDGWLGAGKARVILPITDPYVVHHGALGSFATVYLPDDADQGTSSPASRRSRASNWRWIAPKAAGASSCRRDRVGDVIVVSARSYSRSAPRFRHRSLDLPWPLRSHGGTDRAAGAGHRQSKLKALPAGYHLRSFNAFDLACTYTYSMRLSFAEESHLRKRVMGVLRKRRCGPLSKFDRRRTALRIFSPYTNEVIGTSPKASHERYPQRLQDREGL